MSNHRSRKIAVGAALAIAASAAACRNDSITDLNKNPNSPEDVPASTLFTNGVRVAVNSWMGQLYDLRAAEFLIQHMAEAQYPDEDRYARLGAGNTSNVFASPYPNELEDFQKVVGKGQAAKSPGTWAPAQIMQTWEFDYLTNTFGDIPYFQALKGDSLGGSISPAYDTQKDIYTDMFAKLTAASTALTGATPDLGRADPICALAWRSRSSTSIPPPRTRSSPRRSRHRGVSSRRTRRTRSSSGRETACTITRSRRSSRRATTTACRRR
jgi:hypothetical protein